MKVNLYIIVCFKDNMISRNIRNVIFSKAWSSLVDKNVFDHKFK